MKFRIASLLAGVFLSLGCPEGTDTDAGNAMAIIDAGMNLDGGAHDVDAGPGNDHDADAGPPNDIHQDAGVYVELAHGIETRCVDEPLVEDCDSTAPLATHFATVLDMTNPNAIDIGQCDNPEICGGGEKTILPGDPAAYPMLIYVDSAGWSGSCSQDITCQTGEYGPTQYGIAFQIELSNPQLNTRISVNSPWRIVSGGCGETSTPHACLGGYLEWAPTTNLSHPSGFGIATADENPPVAELIIEHSHDIPWQYGCNFLECD